MTGRTLVAALAAVTLLAGCEQAPQSNDRSAGNPEKYSRDRDLCQAQVDEYMRSRRRVDDATNETFRNDTARAGRDGLATQMANYGDSRNADKFMASCMDARGWPQPQKSWWQRIGS